MADLLVKGGLIVTMDENLTVIRNGFLLVDDGRISQIGRDPGRLDAGEVINAEGMIVMPGLVCAHTHFSRILARGMPLEAMRAENVFELRNLWCALDGLLRKEDIYACVLASCIKYLRNGVTSVAGILPGVNPSAGVLTRALSAAQEVGMRVAMSIEADEQGGRLKGAHGMRESERLIRRIRKRREPNITGFVSVKLTPATSEELLRYGKEIVLRYKVPLLLHAGDGMWMRGAIYQLYGQGPIDRLAELGLLRQETVLAHYIPTDDELERVREKGVRISYTLADILGGTGIGSLIGKGIRVGLGDDGLLPDMFEMVRTVSLLQRLSTGRGLQPAGVLRTATLGGAEVCGLHTGCLKKGWPADITILDASGLPTPVDTASVVNHVVEGCDGGSVKTVIVGGRVLVRDGKIQTVDEERVLEQCRRVAERVWEKVMER